MHFSGIAGMPRRIPDYPDTFYGFNAIASIGSFISTLSLFVFFSAIFLSLGAYPRTFKSSIKFRYNMVDHQHMANLLHFNLADYFKRFHYPANTPIYAPERYVYYSRND